MRTSTRLFFNIPLFLFDVLCFFSVLEWRVHFASFKRLNSYSCNQTLSRGLWSFGHGEAIHNRDYPIILSAVCTPVLSANSVRTYWFWIPIALYQSCRLHIYLVNIRFEFFEYLIFHLDTTVFRDRRRCIQIVYFTRVFFERRLCFFDRHFRAIDTFSVENQTPVDGANKSVVLYRDSWKIKFIFYLTIRKLQFLSLINKFARKQLPNASVLEFNVLKTNYFTILYRQHASSTGDSFVRS